MGTTGLFITLVSSFSAFFWPPFRSLGFTAIKSPVSSQLTPNVLRTVAELNPGTVQSAINQLGSSLFYLSVLGIAILIARAAIEAYRKERDSEKVTKDIFYAAVLTIWFVATLFAVTKGIRFVLLIVPAFSIAFGVVFGLVINYVGIWLNREFKFNKIITMSIVFFLLFLEVRDFTWCAQPMERLKLRTYKLPRPLFRLHNKLF